MDRYIGVIQNILKYSKEEEWFEFKENWFDAQGIGEYISALSNAAAICKKDFAYLIWGINDKTHEITGTTFNFRRDIKNEPLEHFLARQTTPDIAFAFYEVFFEERRLILLEIPKAKQIPTTFNNVRYIRIGSSKVNVAKYPEREAKLFEILREKEKTIQNYMGESIPVNQRLSDIFLQLHISERSGRGVPKIIELYSKDVFEFRENSISVNIPFRRINHAKNKVKGIESLNDRRKKILEELRNNPNLTIVQLSEVIGVGVTATENNIKFLRENGYIERIGSKKGGYWKVK